MKEEKMTRARDLYFNEGKTQKEIAETVGVCERTIHGWIKRFAWDKLKQAAYHAPAIIADNLCSQIVELQNAIADREPGKRFPTVQEAEITRKLMCCLEKVQKSSSLAQNMQMLESFTRFVRTKNEPLCKSIHYFGKQYLEERAINGFKPYDMEYYPYNISPFSFFDENEEPGATLDEGPAAENNFSGQPANPTPEHTKLTDIQHDTTSNPQPPLPQKPENSRKNEHTATTPATPLMPYDEITLENRKIIANLINLAQNGFPDSSAADNEPASGNNTGVSDQYTTLADDRIGVEPPHHAADNDNLNTDANNSESQPQDETPITFTSQYFITLPPEKRPSPFREGNIIWINHADDLENNLQYIKMSDTIRYYPGMDPANRAA